MARVFRGFVPMLALVAGLTCMPVAAQAAFPGANGKIAFGSNQETCRHGCAHTLFTVNPDGSELASLHSPEAADPAWSADGTRLAFEGDPFGAADIYVRESDGTLTQLTQGPDGEPAWSPDGTKIAFTRVVPVGDGFRAHEIHVMSSDGSNVTRLTYSDADGLGLAAEEPAWSPDGTKIAFTRVIGRSGGFDLDQEIYVMNADGTGVTRVTHHFTPNNTSFDDSDYGPDWAPDGSRIAFSTTYGNNAGIHTIRPDGTGLVRLTTSSVSHREPAWSPDGTKIVFVGGPSDLQVVNADGSGLADLAPGDPQESDPSWQPIPNRPPDCSGVTATPASLWPPNRHLRTVTLSGATDPDGDAVTITVTGVTHDEGNAAGDWLPGVTGADVRLRADRDPKGDGRVYTVAFHATDERGATCAGETAVTVPRHRN